MIKEREIDHFSLTTSPRQWVQPEVHCHISNWPLCTTRSTLSYFTLTFLYHRWYIDIFQINCCILTVVHSHISNWPLCTTSDTFSYFKLTVVYCQWYIVILQIDCCVPPLVHCHISSWLLRTTSGYEGIKRKVKCVFIIKTVEFVH